MTPARADTVLRALVMAALIAPLLSHAADNGSLYSEALQFLDKGDAQRARPLLESALQAEPRDPRIRLAYASVVTDPDGARDLLVSLSTDSAAPPSIRAQALSRLAGMRYVIEDYAGAAEAYGRACAQSPSSADACREALSVLLAGRAAEAESLVVKMSATDADKSSAAFCRALIALGKRDYVTAFDLCKQALEHAQVETPWRAPAMAGRALCADRLGYATLAVAFRKEFDQAYPRGLERPLLRTGFASAAGGGPDRAGAGSRRDKRDERGQTGGAGYTIQVGSFSDSANAARLQQQLLPTFADVRVVTMLVGGRSYRRVQIGSFPEKRAAEDFAKGKVSTSGLSCKVVSESP